MATNAPTGDGDRNGAVKIRSQVRSGLTGKESERDDTTGKYVNQKKIWENSRVSAARKKE